MGRWTCSIILVAAAARVAATDGTEPWQVGVGEEQKQRARAALDEGNALYVQNLYREAAAAYESALATWNHPAIRFNLAKALIALDRPIEALDHLDGAMQFGPKPLGEVWSEAVNYKSLLDRQIGRLTVRCTQPGVEIVVDGTSFASCPATATRRVRPGRHTVIGRKDGYLTVTRDAVVVGGEDAGVEVQLVTLGDAAITRTRWAPWKPWLVVGASIAVGSLGVLVELDARSKLDDYRDALRAECGELGCAGGIVSPGTRALADQAHGRDRIGVTMMVLGGVGLVAGVTLVVLNRPITEIPTALERGQAPDKISIAPWLDAHGAGLGIAGRL